MKEMLAILAFLAVADPYAAFVSEVQGYRPSASYTAKSMMQVVRFFAARNNLHWLDSEDRPICRKIKGTRNEYLANFYCLNLKDFGYSLVHLRLEGKRIRAEVISRIGRGSDQPLLGPAIRRGNRLYTVGVQTITFNAPPPTAQVFQYLPTGLARLSETSFEDEIGSEGTWFVNDSPNRAILTFRLYPKHLNVPHAGPLVVWHRELRLRGDRYIPRPMTRADTPIALLDDIAGRFLAGDRKGFEQLVPTSLQSRMWQALKEERGDGEPFISPTGQCDDTEELRLSRSKWRLSFRKQSGRYALTKVW